ncbi:MAG TPA: hypothetical protein VGE09_08280 [Pseudoxanthomonas sp.]
MTSNTRSTIIETMARAIVRAKGAEVCASDDEWPLAVAHHRAMTAKHGAAYTNGRSLYTDAFNFAESALAAYEAHLEASGMAVVPVEPTEAMLDHGGSAIIRPSIYMGGTPPGAKRRARDVWASMLAAHTQEKDA